MEIVIVIERGLGISFARVDRLNSIKAKKQDQAEVSGEKIKHNIYNSWDDLHKSRDALAAFGRK